jgi:hypothetical protein
MSTADDIRHLYTENHILRRERDTLLRACEEFIDARRLELESERRRYGLGPLPNTVEAERAIYEAVEKVRHG